MSGIYDLVNQPMMLRWLGAWRDKLRIIDTENGVLRSDQTVYYGRFTNECQVFIQAKKRFEWSTPIGGLHEEGEMLSEDYWRQYFKYVYSLVQTKADYDAVMNHRMLMYLGGKLIGDRIASCDFSRAPLKLLMGFFLYLGQKKIDIVEPKKETPIYYIQDVKGPLGIFREKIVKRIDKYLVSGIDAKPNKKLQDTYESNQGLAEYFVEVGLGRIEDGVGIFMNLNTSNIIIPGDGCGIFSGVANALGKTVVSGDISRPMVEFARDLGVPMVVENGVMTIERGLKQFKEDYVILISFLWKLAPSIINYCVEKDLKFLVYDKFIYYRDSSKHIEYGSSVLRGVRGLGWKGLPIKLSEETKAHGSKPLLTEIVKGPLFFDSLKGLRQLAIYSEMYPFRIVVSTKSKVSSIELYEMSIIHKFELTNDEPKVWLVRCPHNAGKGLSYDVDTWEVLKQSVDINAMVIGAVSQRVTNLFPVAPYTQEIKGKSSKVVRKHPVKFAARIVDSKVISNQIKTFVAGKKYYVPAKAVLVPYVEPLYQDSWVKLVWLRGPSYTYEFGDGEVKFVKFTIVSA